MAAFVCLLFLFGPGEAHVKPKSKPPPKPRVYERKKNDSFFSVLWGFIGRVPPQNKRADEFGLEQIRDIHELEYFIEDGRLVSIPDDELGFRVVIRNEPKEHQYARPWVKEFLSDFAKIYNQEIGLRMQRRLKITSLVRPIEHQQARIVGLGLSSANCEESHQCSLHTRGIAVDISKIGFAWSKEKKVWVEKQITAEEEAWIRKKLAEWHRANVGIDATDEKRLNHFHIIIYPDYRKPDF